MSYYEANTKKDANGKVTSFGASAKLANGQTTIYTGQAQQVALFSSRGPNVKDFNFAEADVLKPNVMGPGFLIWGAWTPRAVDNAAYQGTISSHAFVLDTIALMKEVFLFWSLNSYVWISPMKLIPGNRMITHVHKSIVLQNNGTCISNNLKN